MSGFEMLRFRTIDRDLTTEEKREIDTWSSRFSPSSNGVTYVYHYGSFKKKLSNEKLQHHSTSRWFFFSYGRTQTVAFDS